MYVNENLSMHPSNVQRIFKVVIQRQFKNLSVIELEFVGVKYLRLFPNDINSTCEIMNSAMVLKDILIGCIFDAFRSNYCYCN